MNKIFYSLLVTVFLGYSQFASAQSCGTSGLYPCNATNFPDSAGFENPDSVPCIIQGVAYDTTIQITMFTTFFAAGANQEVDSIQFLSIENLPCGLCWSSNNTYDRFASGEHGCIRISGTTNDPVGQYKLAIKLEAWINHVTTGIVTYPYTVDASGIRMFVRVAASSGNCTPVDTSEAFIGDTATCVTGIASLKENVPGFNVYPNPMNGSATLSFTADRDAQYTFKIYDVTGRLISTSEVEAKPGTNNMTIERGTKPAGGSYSVTRRLSILE